MQWVIRHMQYVCVILFVIFVLQIVTDCKHIYNNTVNKIYKYWVKICKEEVSAIIWGLFPSCPSASKVITEDG